MDTDHACALINQQVVYKPGWNFHADPDEDNPTRAVLVEVDFDAPDTDREHAPDYLHWTHLVTGFVLNTGDCVIDDDVYAELLRAVLRIEEHEAREFLRVRGGDYRAPFHPHRAGGTLSWITAGAVGDPYGSVAA